MLSARSSSKSVLRRVLLCSRIGCGQSHACGGQGRTRSWVQQGGLTLSSCFWPGGKRPCSGPHLKYDQSAVAPASPGALICHSAGTSLLLCISTIITCSTDLFRLNLRVPGFANRIGRCYAVPSRLPLLLCRHTSRDMSSSAERKLVVTNKCSD